MASGMGQELFNASVLILAVAMLAWHNIWMSVHGRDIAEKALASARSVSNGSSASSVIFLVIALAVLREGSETVLFLYGLATSGDDGLRTTIIGGLSGLAAGSLVGGPTVCRTFAHSAEPIFCGDQYSCVAVGGQHGLTSSALPDSSRYSPESGLTNLELI